MFSIVLALAAAQAAPLPPPAAAPEPMTVEVVRDAITDRLIATATLRAAGERIELRCRPSERGELSIRYRSRRWIARGNFLSGEQPVIYRFDDRAPVRGLWHVAERTASLSGQNRVIAFVDALMTSRRLVLRTRDIENRTFDAIFPLGVTRPAIVELLHSCGSPRLNAAILGEE